MAGTLIVISGPTAVGKTSLAIKLAQKYKTAIVSADSRQFYKELEIGTAKPTPEELKAAKHYFVDSHSINDNFNVGDYEREAISLLDNLFNQHEIVILVGGSGLFINSILYGFDDIPSSSESIRANLNERYRKDGIVYLQEQLKTVDPVTFREIDRNNPQRMMRALEVYETTGKPLSQFKNQGKKQRNFDVIQIGLNTDREILYNNINERVDDMVERGLVEEAKRLRPNRQLNPLKTVGYSELFEYFDGNLTLKGAIEKIKQNTRRFAKRQLTWFHKSKDIKWFQSTDIGSILSYLESQLPHLEREERKN